MERVYSEDSAGAVIIDACEANEGRTGIALATDLHERAGTVTNSEDRVKIVRAATTIQAKVGETRTAIFKGAKVGEAYQGQTGTNRVDVTGFVSSDGNVDAAKLEDDDEHEKGHIDQAALWNADSVKLANGKTITRYKASEVGAMSRQKTINWVCTDYQSMYREVTTYIAASQVQEYAKKGDLLGLADAMNRRILGVTKTQHSRVATPRWTASWTK